MLIRKRPLASSLALAAALLGVSVTAPAQPNDTPNTVPGNQSYYAERPWEVYHGPYDQRWFRERDQGYRQHGIPGAGPERDLRIGQRLPPGYRNPQYFVNDWRNHRLMAPPAGYRWYQVGADYVLVNGAGVIAQTWTGR